MAENHIVSATSSFVRLRCGKMTALPLFCYSAFFAFSDFVFEADSAAFSSLESEAFSADLAVFVDFFSAGLDAVFFAFSVFFAAAFFRFFGNYGIFPQKLNSLAHADIL